MIFFKAILIVLGTFSLSIGIIGIFVPGLPTTPFLLLAAGLYFKSSERLHAKLISNRFVGSYLAEFGKKKGMAFKSKLLAIITMWTMIVISCIFLIKPFTIQLIVSAIGIIGTFVMGLIVPTINKT